MKLTLTKQEVLLIQFFFIFIKTSCPMTEQRSMDVLSGSCTRKSKDKLLIN